MAKKIKIEQRLLKKAKTELEGLNILRHGEIAQLVEHWTNQMRILYPEVCAPAVEQDTMEENKLLSYFKIVCETQNKQRKRHNQNEPNPEKRKPILDPATEYTKWFRNVRGAEGLKLPSELKLVKDVFSNLVQGYTSKFGIKLPEGFDDVFLPANYEGRAEKCKTGRDGGRVQRVRISVPGTERSDMVMFKTFDSLKDLIGENNFMVAHSEIGYPVVNVIYANQDTLTITTPLKGRDYRHIVESKDVDEKKRKAREAISTNLGITIDVTQRMQSLEETLEAEGRNIEDIKKPTKELDSNAVEYAVQLGAIAVRTRENRGAFHLDRNNDFTKQRLLKEFYGRYDDAFGTDLQENEKASRTVETYGKVMVPLLNGMKKFVIHGDFHPGNVLTENGDDEKALIFDFKSCKAPIVVDIAEFIGRVGLGQSDIESVLHDLYHGYEENGRTVKGIKTLCDEAGIEYVDFNQFNHDFDIAMTDIYLRNAMTHLQQSQLEADKGEKADQSRIEELSKRASLFYSRALDTMDKYSGKYAGFAELSRSIQDDVENLMGGKLKRENISKNTPVGATVQTAGLSTLLLDEDDFERPHIMDEIVSGEDIVERTGLDDEMQQQYPGRPDVKKIIEQSGQHVGPLKMQRIQEAADMVYTAGMNLLGQPTNRQLQVQLGEYTRKYKSWIDNLDPDLQKNLLAAAIFSPLHQDEQTGIQHNAMPEKESAPKLRGPRGTSVWEYMKRDLSDLKRVIQRKPYEVELCMDWPKILADSVADGSKIDEEGNNLIITSKNGTTVTLDRLLDDGGYISRFEQEGKKVVIDVTYQDREKPYQLKVKPNVRPSNEIIKGLVVGGLLSLLLWVGYSNVEEGPPTAVGVRLAYREKDKRFNELVGDSTTLHPRERDLYDRKRGDYIVVLNVGGQKVEHINDSAYGAHWKRSKNKWAPKIHRDVRGNITSLEPIRISLEDAVKGIKPVVQLTTAGIKRSHYGFDIDVEFGTDQKHREHADYSEIITIGGDSTFKSRHEGFEFSVPQKDTIKELSAIISNEDGTIGITRAPVIVGNPKNKWYVDGHSFDVGINEEKSLEIHGSYLDKQENLSNSDDVVFRVRIPGLNLAYVSKGQLYNYDTPKVLFKKGIFNLRLDENEVREGYYKVFFDIVENGEVNTVQRIIGIGRLEGKLSAFDPYDPVEVRKAERGLELKTADKDSKYSNINLNNIQQHKPISFSLDGQDYKIDICNSGFVNEYCSRELRNLTWVDVSINGQNPVRLQKNKKTGKFDPVKTSIGGKKYSVSLLNMEKDGYGRNADIYFDLRINK